MQPKEAWENQRFYGLIGWQSPALLERPAWSDAYGWALALRDPPKQQRQRGATGSEGAEAPGMLRSGPWEVVVSHATDAEGWQYASVFKHFDYRRPGGRASQRTGDFVRRRLWRREGEGASATHQNGRQQQQQHAVLADGSSQREEEEEEGVEDGRGGMLDGRGAAGDATQAAAPSPSEAALGAVSGALQSGGSKFRQHVSRDKQWRSLKLFMTAFVAAASRRHLWASVPWDPASVFVLYGEHAAVYRELLAYYRRSLGDINQAPALRGVLPGHSLIQDLLCAAIHSRAAYGYAMAAGHVSSLTSFLLMKTVTQISFDPASGVSIEANNEAVAALAGIQPGDLVMAEWNNSAFRPCHYVAVDRGSQCVVVAVRGSLEMGDIISDFTAEGMDVQLAGRAGHVHEGMMAAATYVQCNTAEALRAAAQRHPGWPVMVVGHSLGGGVASLLTLLLQEPGMAPPQLGPVRGIAIGPAATMSHGLAQACNELVTSVVLGGDVIPRICYASAERLLAELCAASPMRRLTGSITTKVTEQVEGLKKGTTALLGDAAAVMVAAANGAALGQPGERPSLWSASLKLLPGATSTSAAAAAAAAAGGTGTCANGGDSVGPAGAAPEPAVADALSVSGQQRHGSCPQDAHARGGGAGGPGGRGGIVATAAAVMSAAGPPTDGVGPGSGGHTAAPSATMTGSISRPPTPLTHPGGERHTGNSGGGGGWGGPFGIMRLLTLGQQRPRAADDGSCSSDEDADGQGSDAEGTELRPVHSAPPATAAATTTTTYSSETAREACSAGLPSALGAGDSSRKAGASGGGGCGRGGGDGLGPERMLLAPSASTSELVAPEQPPSPDLMLREGGSASSSLPGTSTSNGQALRHQASPHRRASPQALQQQQWEQQRELDDADGMQQQQQPSGGVLVDWWWQDGAAGQVGMAATDEEDPAGCAETFDLAAHIQATSRKVLASCQPPALSAHLQALQAAGGGGSGDDDVSDDQEEHSPDAGGDIGHLAGISGGVQPGTDGADADDAAGRKQTEEEAQARSQRIGELARRAAQQHQGHHIGERGDAVDQPDHMYPAGRVIWILPGAATPAAGAEQQPGGAMGRVGSEEEAMEVEMTQIEGAAAGTAAAGAAAAGAAGRPASSVPAPSEDEAQDCEQQQQVSSPVWFGGAAGSGRQHHPLPDAQQSQQQAQQAPVVVRADRKCFERILLQPDMAKDHLPDAYLAAIKQL